MDAHAVARRPFSLQQAQNWLAFGTGALLLGLGASRRSRLGALVALSAVPFLIRAVVNHHGDTKRALRGARGVHVRAATSVEVPIEVVYGFWRRLGNLPLFMSHLESVTETSEVMSHWIARGPAGISVEWDAEIINEIENEVIGWRSLPGSDVVMAGSVNFGVLDDGKGTEIEVHLQYSPPGGRVGALMSQLLGRDPAHAVREDLRHFRQFLEAREVPVSVRENGDPR